jgi:hypothetical protein
MAATGTIAAVTETILAQPGSPGPPAWVLYGIGIVGLVIVALLVALLFVVVRRHA